MEELDGYMVYDEVIEIVIVLCICTYTEWSCPMRTKLFRRDYVLVPTPSFRTHTAVTLSAHVYTFLLNRDVSSHSQSLFLPDAIINPHPRFPTLTENIRERRGCKVAINVPST